MYEGIINSTITNSNLHKPNIKKTKGYSNNENSFIELKSRFTDSNVHEMIREIPEPDLEDIGIRVERVNLNIKNILVTGGAGFM